MHVVALVVALAGPDRRARQARDQVLADHVELADGGGAGLVEGVVLAAVGIGAAGFPVVTLVGAVGDHAVDVEAAVAFAPHLLAEADLGVGFAFVAQTIFRRSAGGLEAGLVAAAGRGADARTQIAVEIDRQGRAADQQGGKQAGGFEDEQGGRGVLHDEVLVFLVNAESITPSLPARGGAAR